MALERGAKRFGLHTMVASNERDYTYIVETTRMLLQLATMVENELGIRFEFLNIGGGLGIPYRPEDAPLDLVAMAREITGMVDDFKSHQGYAPRIYMESGRWMTGPHGVLVTRAINHKNIYRKYIGVDACMSSLMRPGMYGAYHHIDVIGKQGQAQTEVYDVVGSLCENNDKFAIQRNLPLVQDRDLLAVHDTGAHGYAMGFQYNGRLRPKELLLRADGSVELIRRAETCSDYFQTLHFTADVFTARRR
jgi:diaminopimelate decarboxylase